MKRARLLPCSITLLGGSLPSLALAHAGAHPVGFGEGLRHVLTQSDHVLGVLLVAIVCGAAACAVRRGREHEDLPAAFRDVAGRPEARAQAPGP